MRTSWKQRWKATYLKKYIFYKFIKDKFLYIIKWVIQNVFYSICIKNSFPLRGNMVSVLQFLLKKKIQFRCICCVSFTRWGKTNDVRLLFSGIEWTKFASREKWFLSHRHMHWSDCLWVVYSMYLYIFALFGGFGRALWAYRAWDLVGCKGGFVKQIHYLFTHSYVCMCMCMYVYVCLQLSLCPVTTDWIIPYGWWYW